MRLSCLLFLPLILFATTACSDPQCQPDEVKVGIMCRPLRGQPDASTDSTDGHEIADRAAADGGAEKRDAANVGDASSPLPPAEDASSAVGPDAILDTLPGGPPSFQFRADTVTLSGSNVASIPNRRGSDALVVAAGTLAAPASDNLSGGAPSLVFTGAQWLDSNLASRAWTFLHDGTGAEVFNVFAATTAGTSVVWATTSGGMVVGTQMYTSSGGSVGQVNNGSAGIVGTSINAAITTNTATYQDWYYSSTSPLHATLFSKEAAQATQLQSGSPSHDDPAGPLRLGAQPGGNNPAHMRWCETLIFPRVLHEYERQLVREYIAARYGIAAPSLTGADREIMSMLPFAFMDASYYSTAAGKVTAFGDRARPGHSFSQGSSDMQVDTPTASANFNGQLVVKPTGTQSYSSTLLARAWSFAHDGTGYTAFHPMLSAGSATFQIVAETTNAIGAVPGLTHYMMPTGAFRMAISKMSGSALSDRQYAVAAMNTALLLEVAHGSARTPNSYLKRSGASAATADYGNAPESAAPQKPLEIMGRTGAAGVIGEYPGFVVFNRLLTDDEAARVRVAIQSKWGVSP